MEMAKWMVDGQQSAGSVKDRGRGSETGRDGDEMGKSWRYEKKREGEKRKIERERHERRDRGGDEGWRYLRG